LVIKAVQWIDEVLEIALLHMPQPMSDEDFLASEADATEKPRISAH
jgi:ATP-dependent Lon protease